MTNKEIIEDYLINVYMFASNIDGWCVRNKLYGRDFILQRAITDMERVFPEMDAKKIVNDWWKRNVDFTTTRIHNYLSDYHLELGNKMVQAWDIITYGGKEFDFEGLMRTMPEHHNRKAIMIIFDEWFDEKLLEASMKEIEGK